MSNDKKNLGQKKKEERLSADAILSSFAGQSVDDLKREEKDKLLTAILQILGRCDSLGKIK